MIVTRIEVGVARKISRNYNSTEVSIVLAADLEPADDPETVRAALGDRCLAGIRAEFKKLNAAAPNGGSTQEGDS